MKTYLKTFDLPSIKLVIREQRYFDHHHDNYYPFGVFHEEAMPKFEFEPITIFYGGNGSGKSTLLNLIAENLYLPRTSEYNRTDFFEKYARLCDFEESRGGVPRNSKIITSDDVFNYLLDMRNLNNGIDLNRAEVLEHYCNLKHSDIKLRSMDDYDDYKEYMETQKLSSSQYVKKYLKPNVKLNSNGESAMEYFLKQIDRNALYLLDEPENSLSPKFQFALKEFLEDSTVGVNCQFIIATHSPILLSMENAKIYDLDCDFPVEKNWTELENVRAYFEFFEQRRNEFL